MKHWLVASAFAAVTAIAVAGWARKPAPQPARAVVLQPIEYATPQALAPVNPPVREVAPRPAASRRVASSTYASRVVVRKPRSKKKSAAIIAGTAGTGAAIGALAGGGKGAAIGAISGGAAGVVYDQATRNR
jgi:hypothetical protein